MPHHRPTLPATTVVELARQLADQARVLRQRLQASSLFASLDPALVPDHADALAQTLAYGLLAARLAPALQVPLSTSSLRKLLSPLFPALDLAAFDFDAPSLAGIRTLLTRADLAAVLRDFQARYPGEDPLIHFYEIFLKEYDPARRRRCGVFYTPRPVVAFIVRSAHEALRREFGLPMGLANAATWGEFLQRHPTLALPRLSAPTRGLSPETPFVQILDPAAGAAAFLVEVIDVIHRTMMDKWRSEGLDDAQRLAAWRAYVPRHLLPRLHGCELLPAPCAIARLNIGLKLAETGCPLTGGERVHVECANALDSPREGGLDDRRPFTVVLGNPPYANFGRLNKSLFIMGLLEDYKRGLAEKKLNLDDDFIKFIRLGQHCIEQSGAGLLALITNNTFLDGPTRRGMRRSLAEAFPLIHILDLHGGAIERERAPDGSADQNVFDIQQGVAITLFLRPPAPSATPILHHAHLYGTRAYKLARLKFVVPPSGGPEFGSPAFRRNSTNDGISSASPCACSDNVLGKSRQGRKMLAQHFSAGSGMTKPSESRQGRKMLAQHFSAGKSVTKTPKSRRVDRTSPDPESLTSFYDSGVAQFTTLPIAPPLYRFQPHATALSAEYNQYFPLNEIFITFGSGVSTDRDDLCYDLDLNALSTRMRQAFAGGFPADFAARYRITDTSSYDLTRRLRAGAFDPAAIHPCLYRLFDTRWLYYQPGFTSRPAWPVMRHLLPEESLVLVSRNRLNSDPACESAGIAASASPNLALLAKRQARDGEYNWFFVTSGLVVNGLFSIDNKGREQVFPLYLLEGETRRPNFTPRFLQALFARLGQPDPLWDSFAISESSDSIRNPQSAIRNLQSAISSFRIPHSAFHISNTELAPEDVFHYIYAVFHSPTFRTRYLDFLKLDFPRLPLTPHLALFRALARLGSELVALHLLTASESQAPLPAYTGPAAPVVEKAAWAQETIWIDKARTAGFHNVPQSVWCFQIGGHQVCAKWLKDRKGRTLSGEEIAHFRRVLHALAKTLRLMPEIDKLIERHGGWPDAFYL